MTDCTVCQPTVSVVHRFAGGLCGSQQTEPPHIHTLPHFNILAAIHNRNWLMEYKRTQCHVCSTKNIQKQNSSVENATKGCMPPHVSRYITPNWIFEDLLTLKWKRGTHKCHYILAMELLNWYFLETSSWWDNGGEWGVDFMDGGLWRKRDLSDEPLCMVSAWLCQ